MFQSRTLATRFVLGAGKGDTRSSMSQVAIPSGKVAVPSGTLLLPFSALAWSAWPTLGHGVGVGYLKSGEALGVMSHTVCRCGHQCPSLASRAGDRESHMLSLVFGNQPSCLAIFSSQTGCKLYTRILSISIVCLACMPWHLSPRHSMLPSAVSAPHSQQRPLA